MKANGEWEDFSMFWLGMTVGILIGGNLGVLVMAVFKINRNS